MLSSTISRHAGDRGDRVEGEPVAGMDLEALARGQARRAREPVDLAGDALHIVLERFLAVGARVQFHDVGADARPQLRSAPASGSMNSDTRMPAALRSRTTRASWAPPPMTLRPPSVVRSSRRSGTRQHALGTWRKAISSISSVAAISRLSGQVSSAFRRADVAVGDVPPVLAQVRGDAVGAALQRRGARRARDRDAVHRARYGWWPRGRYSRPGADGEACSADACRNRPGLKAIRRRWGAASYDDGAKLGRHSCKYSRRPRP